CAKVLGNFWSGSNRFGVW
nr:immunoglobulin heavy chain junction region [Macaca mulatta]